MSFSAGNRSSVPAKGLVSALVVETVALARRSAGAGPSLWCQSHPCAEQGLSEVMRPCGRGKNLWTYVIPSPNLAAASGR